MAVRSPRTLSPRRLALLASLLFIGAIATGAQDKHRARLSDDLPKHESKHSSSRVSVIVQGSHDEIASLAAKHHIVVIKWLGTGAVVSANSNEITDLASDAGVDHLSGDPLVRGGLAVSNLAIGADLTRAGAPGLLGIGGIAGVNGQGIGGQTNF